MLNPKCPKKSPTNITAETPRETLPILSLPAKNPKLIAKNKTINDCAISGSSVGVNNILNHSNILLKFIIKSSVNESLLVKVFYDKNQLLVIFLK
jgi:hypothetical protein